LIKTRCPTCREHHSAGQISRFATDFADVALLAMAERLNVLQVASVDSDFAIYRLSGRRRFENIFLLRK
jgi:predicted nucleic acid-binding protein